MTFPRKGFAASLAVAALLATGCTAPLPGVSFFDGSSRAVASPSIWCTPVPATGTIPCSVDSVDGGAAVLPASTVQPVSINVPGSVGASPWVVLLQYRTNAGEVQEFRGPVLTAGELTYTLRPPADAAALSRVEVQSGLTPTVDGQGKLEYAATRTWVLTLVAG